MTIRKSEQRGLSPRANGNSMRQLSAQEVQQVSGGTDWPSEPPPPYPGYEPPVPQPPPPPLGVLPPPGEVIVEA